MESILALSLSYDNKLEGYGTLSEHVEKVQITLAGKNKESFRCIMENYEQELEDAKMTNKKYELRDRKTAIKLQKRADLKNRLLINQLRDLCVVRQIVNHVKNSFGVVGTALDEKFISDLRRVFELLTRYLRDTYTILT